MHIHQHDAVFEVTKLLSQFGNYKTNYFRKYICNDFSLKSIKIEVIGNEG